MNMKMWTFVAGAVFGFVCGVMVTAEAARDGYLFGWTVTSGKIVMCEEPYLWVQLKEIECDRRRRR